MFKLKNNHLRDDKASQIVSWGHWFTLFNIFIVIILGSRYLLIADWPPTFMGRFYAIISSVSHFSFLTFITYLVILFPLSFFLHSPRWHRIIAVIVATIGITLLLIDIEIFSHFRMHLNFSIWQILTSTDGNIFSDKWQRLFIFIPLIILIETLFAVWSWRKLRSLTKRRRMAKPFIVVFIVCFLASHLIHIWADANFYRPITMQRSSLPLSYPMTARHFLERYGFIEPGNYQTRLNQEGNPFAIAIEYPIGKIKYERTALQYNVLMVVVEGWNNDLLTEKMPVLNQFAQQNINFTNHYSASSNPSLSEFSLFYGLEPNYYNSILAGHKQSALLSTITNQRYNIGLFSTNGFGYPLYRYALLSNFSLPEPNSQSNKKTTEDWLQWNDEQNKMANHAPWFSIIQYQLANQDGKKLFSNVALKAQQLDQNINHIIQQLKDKSEFEQTIIIITGSNGIQLDGNKKYILKVDSADYRRELLKTPLIISWPQKENKEINKLTSHTDIMRTLMQDALQVTNNPQLYSQGINLFANIDRQYLIAGNESYIAALYENRTVVLDELGYYKIYDVNNQLQEDEKLSLPLFLQIITENRRFMVTN